MATQRTLQSVIHQVNETFPVLLITGPRQVGKTTLLKMCAESGRQFVSLDNLELRQLAQNDPALFLKMYPPPIVIDEVQYAPNLFIYIKIAVDEDRKNGQFWLTGSQKFHLMKGVTESLAGRVAILDLLGLSQSELSGHAHQIKPFIPTVDWIEKAGTLNKPTIKLLDLYQRIWLGSFPALYRNTKTDRDLFYRSYVQTYLQRDVKDILKISDDTIFYNFLRAVAARTGQQLNYNNLARDVAIDTKTAKSWLSILQTSGLVYLLQPYYRNVTKRLVKSPKLYFLDTGLCTYLTQWPDAKTLESGAMSGAILETYLFSEILKSYWHNGKQPNFYYYRDLDQREVVLVIETGEAFYPIEFKKTATPSLSASKHFKHLEKLGKPIGEGAVICLSHEAIPLSSSVMVIPVDYL